MPRYLTAMILVLPLSFTASCLAQADVESTKCSKLDFTQVLSCYREKLAAEPLVYSLLSKENLPELEWRRYQLTSQNWSPENLVSPAEWQHEVEIFIPENSPSKRALVIINNGTNHGTETIPPSGPTDFAIDRLQEIARDTNTVVIAISAIPNQYLEYQPDKEPVKEDYSVARSWYLFMDAPETRSILPLHVPMAAAISQAMTMAQQALPEKALDSFIVSGVSKRGWTTWLTAIADPRVEGIVPFVIDLLGTHAGLEHMYRSYGGNWPIAFAPYYQQEIDKKLDTPGFAKLMQIIDPLQYLSTEYESRLDIPKYIVNASGDDFYVPDNTDFYYDKLPGDKVLRVAPNSSHYGIKAFSEQSLITFVNRLQQSKALPQLNASIDIKNKVQTLTASLSEKPDKVLLWTAINPNARDFRYACDVRYTEFPLAVTPTNTLEVAITPPATGWQATFIEATFSDGFVATSPVYILPKDVYPTTAPPTGGPACKTLAGRKVIPVIAEINNSVATATNQNLTVIE
ncbi:TPA: PhoPQ-regulated protein [Yersinia enterocolitica]|uniref:PhoPQ-activated pathogenicity-related family protein n=1 Tax=Yersinia enterocolitica TaxID=630 RepID=UPI001CA4E109|nr:PhoPQ-activated protein PqaA family protein [Yersinia enterocolitica]MBW5835605.1 PhoPQ-regulated protein [Yersinia enterocolitica]HEN3566347.1 PhoPQ-regulated protein [Yersinia enterocolitica]HEN3571008.1 PhoPQ-regulated protein [Yersinia enterocolitica]HEN3574839.1 PhoPQ-regulated protein [Yersinia enterocolitica]HEN3605419.1 PhoPQ-regulated protein [Yersinia enterocolitica]